MLGEMLATTGAPETCKFKISVRINLKKHERKKADKKVMYEPS
jgi:hypothetical protein